METEVVCFGNAEYAALLLPASPPSVNLKNKKHKFLVLKDALSLDHTKAESNNRFFKINSK